MNLEITEKYNNYSTSVFLYLLHNNKEFNSKFIDAYPDLEGPASNFFNDENCGCKPRLVVRYKKSRFQLDLMIVQFINENPDCINLDSFFESEGFKDISGATFAVNNTEADYRDFLATIGSKNIKHNGFSSVPINDKILVSFF